MPVFDVPKSSRHTFAMEPRSLAEVGELVADRRMRLRLDQASLARAANVDPKTIRSLERGERWPRDSSRARIEFALHWESGSLGRIRAGGEATAIDGVAAVDEMGNEFFYADPQAPDVPENYQAAAVWKRDAGGERIGGELSSDDEANLAPELLEVIGRIAESQGSESQLADLRREVEQTQKLLAPMAHIPEVQARYARLMFQFALDSLKALGRQATPQDSGTRLDFTAPKWIDEADDFIVVRILSGSDPAQIDLITQEELARYGSDDIEILGSIPSSHAAQSAYGLARRTAPPGYTPGPSQQGEAGGEESQDPGDQE